MLTVSRGSLLASAVAIAAFGLNTKLAFVNPARAVLAPRRISRGMLSGPAVAFSIKGHAVPSVHSGHAPCRSCCSA